MAEQKKKGLSRLNKAILFLITSAFFFALMNMFVRLSGDVPTIQKTFFRNFFALFIASGAMIKNRCSIILPKGARFDLFMRAAYTFVRRATGKGVKSYYVVFFFSAFSTLVAFPLMLLDFKPMTLVQTLMLVGSGVSAAIAQFCITTAYSYAPANEVSIYDYSQIIFAALIGFVVLDQVPDVLSFVGYAVIIAAAFVMFRYNNRKTKE